MSWPGITPYFSVQLARIDIDARITRHSGCAELGPQFGSKFVSSWHGARPAVWFSGVYAIEAVGATWSTWGGRWWQWLTPARVRRLHHVKDR